jgi:hypothetical protein
MLTHIVFSSLTALTMMASSPEPIAIRASEDSADARIAAARTPNECINAANEAYIVARRAGATLSDSVQKTAAMVSARTARQSAAARCAQQFDPARVPAEQLAALGKLYDMAALASGVRAIYDRRIALATTPTVRDSAYLAALRYYGRFDASAEQRAVAEGYLARIDALGPDGDPLKVQAHALMINAYPIRDPRVREHAERAVALVRALPAEQKEGDLEVLAFFAAAEVEANQGNPKRALTLLEEAKAALPTDTSLVTQANAAGIRALMGYYRLIGTTAPAIRVDRWVNRAGGDSLKGPVRLTGIVTVLDFSTMACGACVAGYPMLRRIDANFRARGVQTLLLTAPATDGRPSTFEQRVDAVRKYWVGEAGIQFPIGVIQNIVDESPDAVAGATFAPVETAYKLRGWPMYVIVDRHGVIRYIQYGHAPEAEARFTTFLEELLKEAPVASTL